MKVMMENMKSFWKACSFQNLKRNWYFPISAGAFFCLNIRITKASAFGIVIAFLASCILAAYSKSIIDYVKASHGVTIFSVITSVGIGIGVLNSFTFEDEFNQSDKIKNLLNRSVLFDIAGIICCVAGIVFICIFVILFWKKAGRLSKWKSDLLSLSKGEAIIYTAMILVLCTYVIYAFSRSVVFYDVHPYDFLYDAIYSSDSTDLFQPSAYLWPSHTENDLRQPLFALFSAPFLGIPYLISLPFSVPIRAMIMNCAQVIMLVFANLLIAKSMKFNSIFRICFMALSFCMYSNLLFTVMMEQYIVIYFWLSTVVYMFCRWEEYDELPMLAAGGTLLAGFALLPFFPTDHFSLSKNALKSWFMRVSKLLLKYIGLMAIFCRFDIVFNFIGLSKLMMNFTGKNVGFTNRLFQFSEFIKGCFVAPNAGVDFTTKKHVAWFLKPATGFNWIGIFLLCLAVISAVINRRKRSCLISGAWVTFSFVVLAIVGWGTKENGLILYALYFGWAYLVLILQLIITLCEKWKLDLGVGFISAIACTGMLFYNIPAIRDLLQFAFQFYPL